MTRAQLRTWNNLLYSDTGSQGCKKSIAIQTKGLPGTFTPTGYYLSGFTSYKCFTTEAGESSPYPTIELVDLAKENHCNCTATGPYTTIDYVPAPSGPFGEAMWKVLGFFPPGLKKAVIAKNYMLYSGAFGSDGWEAGSTLEPFHYLQKIDPTLDNAAEIDHIIPRRDISGCRCGGPSKNNAAVVSRAMNGGMSNESPLYNEARALMFKKYVQCPDPAWGKYLGQAGGTSSLVDQVDEMAPIDFDEDERQRMTDVDPGYFSLLDDERREASRPGPDTDDTVEAGGCAATTDSAGVLFAGALLLVLRRRKR